MFLRATNITSPLGLTTDENYRAVRQGLSRLMRHEAGVRGVPFPFCASLFDQAPSFVELAVASAREALAQAQVDAASSRTLFVLSTTKGVIGTPPGQTAQEIANQLGVTSKPIVVCNACISGLAAQVLALRIIESGAYDDVVVTGCDVQGKFIISGFSSLKALSPEPCRPFDEDRLGLNLGEGAATMIFSSKGSENDWQLIRGAVRNDAFHISGPHPQGEGALRALSEVLEGFDKDELATIGVHGTATMFNDQMESKAIARAGLSHIPASALKGYYGHTMGAAGVIETILTARALDDGIVLPSRGFAEIGVSGKMTISGQAIATDKRAFVKQLSGFGGCNGAALFVKGKMAPMPAHEKRSLEPVASVALSSADDLTAIYKSKVGNYPKFYKMDTLSRLAFVGTELLKSESDIDMPDDATAVILFNRTSSCISDRNFTETISDDENFFPSPSVFVYTLPNIATGEIAMRNGFHGETSFYILPDRDEELMTMVLEASLLDTATQAVIGGWIDANDNDDYTLTLKKYLVK